MEELGMTGLLADNIGVLGMLDLVLGDVNDARLHLRRAMDLTVEAGSEMGIAQMLLGVALLAQAEGRHERAARLLGAQARIQETLGGAPPPELLAPFGDPEADARTALDDETFERAWAKGRAMTTEEAVAYALEEEG
ncbi:MAG: hypothetical protein ACRDI0_05490 [Actinomycetota bacterium]